MVKWIGTIYKPLEKQYKKFNVEVKPQIYRKSIVVIYGRVAAEGILLTDRLQITVEPI